MLWQPDGLEGLRRVVEDLLARHLAAAGVPEHGVAPSDLDTAGPPARLYLSKQHQPVTEIDQLLRLRPVVGPAAGPLSVEAEEAIVPAVNRIEIPHVHPFFGWVHLDIWVIERKESFKVPAVVGRLPHTHGAPEQSLPDARAGRQPEQDAAAEIEQPGKARREPLLRRATRPFPRGE